jgi:hypothetical protein
MKANDMILQVSDTGGWNVTIKELSRLSFNSTHSGDTLTMTTHAREFTIGYQYSPDLSAQMEVDWDGIAVDTLANNFPGGFSKLALNKIYLETTARQHTVRLINLTNSSFLLDYLFYAK